MAVRLVPSQRFTYVERALPPLFLMLRPPAAAPSTLVEAMPLREFAERAQAACALPPLVYAPREFCYMQTPLWPALLADVDLAGPPFCAVRCPGAQACESAGKAVSWHAHVLRMSS